MTGSAVILSLVCSNLPVTAKEIVEARLPSLGHRNWIVVADSAYPLQTALGIETVTVKETQLGATLAVTQALKKAKHVRPNIFVDKELSYLDDSMVTGINSYRTNLEKILKGQKVEKLPHEDIIKMLDEAGETFKVLLIKTPHTQPYTSVFFRLECGYWSDASEKALREKMKGGGE
jgi:hypothetical protein